jgi:hypothetical protein
MVPVVLPTEFVTVTVMAYDPAAGVVPASVPVVDIVTPEGSPVAAKDRGDCPVAPTVNRSGLAGFDENTVAPTICGLAAGAVIDIVAVV